jgi:hypothetical protein
VAIIGIRAAQGKMEAGSILVMPTAKGVTWHKSWWFLIFFKFPVILDECPLGITGKKKLKVMWGILKNGMPTYADISLSERPCRFFYTL